MIVRTGVDNEFFLFCCLEKKGVPLQIHHHIQMEINDDLALTNVTEEEDATVHEGAELLLFSHFLVEVQGSCF